MKQYSINKTVLVVILIFALTWSFGDSLNCNTTCGGTFKERQSVITTPDYPKDYPPSVCCDYIILSPYRCSTDFHIQLLDFHLEFSLKCKNDVLKIGNTSKADESVENLCGHLTGIRKYTSENGILHIRFISNNFVKDKGFRLLITRFPCKDETNITHRIPIDALKSTPEKLEVTQPILQLLPPFQDQHQNELDESNFIRHPYNHDKKNIVHQSKQYLHNTFNSSISYLLPSLSSPEYPCTQWQQENNYFRPQNNNFLPSSSGSCCAGSFRQQRFYLTSPGFPTIRTDSSRPRDCFYYIEKSGPNVCFLRVGFRFFSLGNLDPYAGECLSDFIEIDGERICGCRSGFVYRTTQEWGLGAKVIRLKTNGQLSDLASIGFLLDVSQVDCGRRYAREVGRNVETEMKMTPYTNGEINEEFILSRRRMKHLVGGGMNSKLFFGTQNPCEFGLTDLLKISFDPLWAARQRC